MEIKLRKIIKEDAAVLSGIAKRSFFDTFTGTCTEEDMQGFLEEYFNEGRMEKEIVEKDNHYFFADADGVPAGFIQFREDYSGLPLMQKWKALELKRIYVLTEYHGKGIAKHLMDYFIEFGIANQYEVVWLGVWEHNLRAQHFYEKYGFAKSGYRHDFPIGSTPQTDDWMWRFL